jgi:hypothetical protein
MAEKTSPYPNAPGYPSPTGTSHGDATTLNNDSPAGISSGKKEYTQGHVYSADPLDNLLASAGVRRIEAINEQFTTIDRWIVFFSVFLVAYCYGLDGTVRYTYQVCPALSLVGGCSLKPACRAMRPIVMRQSDVSKRQLPLTQLSIR